MRSTLFLIPFELGGIPLFGFGLLLAIWAIVCTLVLTVLVRKHGFNREMLELLPSMALVGAAILFLPKVFGSFDGMPIRGYGVMVLIGATGGIAIAASRARRMGLDPEWIVSACFWMIIAGIVCARAFYIVQYWEDFKTPQLTDTLWNIVNYTHGGLVIYGAIFGGAAAFIVFTYRHKLPLLALADLIAPGLAFGIAVGRIGCFLHGCCFGGQCEQPWAVTFPAQSPPFERQVSLGQMHGFRLSNNAASAPIVLSVTKDSDAARAGMSEGDKLLAIDGRDVQQNGDVYFALANAVHSGNALRLSLERNDGQTSTKNSVQLPGMQTPQRSQPIHPTQLYSAALAGALAFSSLVVLSVSKA